MPPTMAKPPTLRAVARNLYTGRGSIHPNRRGPAYRMGASGGRWFVRPSTDDDGEYSSGVGFGTASINPDWFNVLAYAGTPPEGVIIGQEHFPTNLQAETVSTLGIDILHGRRGDRIIPYSSNGVRNLRRENYDGIISQPARWQAP